MFAVVIPLPPEPVETDPSAIKYCDDVPPDLTIDVAVKMPVTLAPVEVVSNFLSVLWKSSTPASTVKSAISFAPPEYLPIFTKLPLCCERISTFPPFCPLIN